MDKIELTKLIRQDESETLEFKESTGEWKEIIKTISAFSNTRGGIILIGVSEREKVLKIQIGKKTIEDLVNKIKENTDPKIFPGVSIEKINGKNIIIIKVEESKSKPVFAFDKVYKRVGKSTLRVTSEEIRKISLEGKKFYWDEQICKEANLKDIDWRFVKEFFIPLYEEVSERRIVGKPVDLLKSLNCIINDKPTNAGILLFGKEPQEFFKNAYIALARYKGKDVDVERLDYKEFNGNLFRQIDECNSYIIGHIAVMSKLQAGKIRREDIPEYGKFSIRELVTNAVCHRDYEDQGSKIIIKMFSDKIEFYNRGGLPNGITPENIVTEQYSRNPSIARILSKVEYIEELGEGWDKIIKEHKTHPLKPKLPRIKADKYSMLVTIFSTKEKFEKTEIVTGLNERQKYIIKKIKSQGFIKSIEVQKQFNITRDTANRDFNYLMKLKMIKREGAGKSIKYIME